MEALKELDGCTMEKETEEDGSLQPKPVSPEESIPDRGKKFRLGDQELEAFAKAKDTDKKFHMRSAIGMRLQRELDADTAEGRALKAKYSQACRT